MNPNSHFDSLKFPLDNRRGLGSSELLQPATCV